MSKGDFITVFIHYAAIRERTCRHGRDKETKLVVLDIENTYRQGRREVTCRQASISPGHSGVKGEDGPQDIS